MKTKKLPVRQCVGCREGRLKKELIRVVRSPEGVITLDFRGKKPGRGAYLCPEKACLDKAKKSKALERAFECAIPDEIYENLYAELEHNMEEEPVE